jgi:hypothetical protein
MHSGLLLMLVISFLPQGIMALIRSPRARRRNATA